VEIPAPDEKDREEIFAVHLRNKPLGPGISAAQLASRTEGLNGAEIASICTKAAFMAVRTAVEAEATNPAEDVEVLIEAVYMEAALEEIKQV
jgi:transitional endoplasmic reticulum ATPase